MVTEDTINPASRSALAVVGDIPTVFGGLLYLAAMWDKSAGSYRCDPRSGITCPEEAEAVLGRAHLRVFFRWLALGFGEQRGDLMRFADNDESGAYQCMRSWWGAGFFDHVAPETASWQEIRLFQDGLALVIKSLVGDSIE